MFHVKHSNQSDTTFSVLRAALERWNSPVDDDTLGRLASFANWAAPGAARLGLTRYADPGEFAERLIGPTLALAQADLRRFIASPVLDFGAGSGALGITAAITWPEVVVTIADRRRRAVRFAEIACVRFAAGNCQARELELSAANLAGDERYSLVLLRAFAPTDAALGLVVPWLASGGAVALWHRPPPPTSRSLELAATSTTGVPDLQLSIYRHGAKP